MLKALFITILLCYTLVNSIDSQETGKGVGKIKNLIEEKKAIETKLTLTKQQLQNCLKRQKVNADNHKQDCTYQRRLKQRFQNEVKQLEIKLASNNNEEGIIVDKLKEKVVELQDNYLNEKSRANRLDNENFILNRQKKQLKLKVQQLLQKFKRFDQQTQDSKKKYQQQLKNIKDKYEKKIKQSTQTKCDQISAQISNQYQQCTNQRIGLIDKITHLENNALNKAKQFAQKIIQTKNQLIARVKNFLSGNGPYTKEDERQFMDFKQKVNNLQKNVREKLNQIEKINKQKEDISLQQRYCRAKLSDFNSQIQQLEREAQAKGKGYYLRQIKRLADQRFSQDRQNQAKPDDSLIRSYQEKLLNLEKKLREQVQQRSFLEKQKKRSQQRCNQFEKQLSKVRKQISEQQSQEARLRQQNIQLKKLIKEIYQLKQK